MSFFPFTPPEWFATSRGLVIVRDRDFNRIHFVSAVYSCHESSDSWEHDLDPALAVLSTFTPHMTLLYPSLLDPDMSRIVELCYRSNIIWSVNKEADRIDFYHRDNPRTVLATFPREADPDDVVATLTLLTVFR